MGDGTTVTYEGYDRQSIFSVSKKLIDDFYEVLIKLGGTGVIKEEICKKDYVYAGRIIKVENKSTLYRLWIKKSRAVHLDFRFIEIKEVDYDGRVYCVSVPNQTFYCRNNRHSFWSGNSEVINLKNVSHNMVELHWNGDELIGTAEILTTPCGNILRELFRNKISVGISSRAMGTLTKISENTSMVGEDLSLLGWDFISNPSCQGAFMAPISPINEGIIRDPSINKWIRTDNIIRNILSELG